MKYKLIPCPNCGDAWLFVSDGGYTSGYEHYGYRVDCICHKAWASIGWCTTKEEACQKWNECCGAKMDEEVQDNGEMGKS